MPRCKAGLEARLFHLNPLFQFFKPSQDNVDSRGPSPVDSVPGSFIIRNRLPSGLMSHGLRAHLNPCGLDLSLRSTIKYLLRSRQKVFYTPHQILKLIYNGTELD
jgi:hypothetical protein